MACRQSSRCCPPPGISHTAHSRTNSGDGPKPWAAVFWRPAYPSLRHEQSARRRRAGGWDGTGKGSCGRACCCRLTSRGCHRIRAGPRRPPRSPSSCRLMGEMGRLVRPGQGGLQRPDIPARIAAGDCEAPQPYGLYKLFRGAVGSAWRWQGAPPAALLGGTGLGLPNCPSTSDPGWAGKAWPQDAKQPTAARAARHTLAL